MMTPRQTIAMQFPCHRADETTAGRFTLLHRPWFSVLTVNK